MSKREALEAIFPKLKKLLPHLGNDNAGEAEAARCRIKNLLASVQLDWHDLTTLLSEKEAPILEMKKVSLKQIGKFLFASGMPVLHCFAPPRARSQMSWLTGIATLGQWRPLNSQTGF